MFSLLACAVYVLSECIPYLRIAIVIHNPITDGTKSAAIKITVNVSMAKVGESPDTGKKILELRIPKVKFEI